MHKRFLSMMTLLLVAGLLVPFSTLGRQPEEFSAATTTTLNRGSTAAPTIETKNETVITKLSPDLRELAKARAKRPVLVRVRVEPGKTDLVTRLMQRSAVSKPLGAFQWVTGEISSANLIKLAGTPGVLSIKSTETFKPAEAPELEELVPQLPNARELRVQTKQEGKDALRKKVESISRPDRQKPSVPSSNRRTSPAAPSTVQVADVHGASATHNKGYTGQGVVASVVDTGVDFGHPDLQGTQARVASGPYAGWPFAYNTLSGVYYAMDSSVTIGPDTYWDNVTSTWYAHTLPVIDKVCDGDVCSGYLVIDYGNPDPADGWPPVVLAFTWPDTSVSGNYRYTVHPDFYLLLAGLSLGLGYAATDIAPPVVIVSDETTAGVYDSVYVDIDFDQDLTDEKAMRKGDELAGADLYDAAGAPGTDGIWDLSAGMLSWISDGTNPPPGVDVLYSGVATPGAGELLSFIGDEDSHGTNCAGDIAAQGVITDPEWIGPVNPLFAGGENAGGAGGAVLAGMAPDTKIAAFQNGFSLAEDSWILSAIGFDGLAESGDEAQIISNSWGSSGVLDDGWDDTARFAQYLNEYWAPSSTFLVATGNGGPGYGTVTSPGGGTVIDVGASTSYGSYAFFEFVDPSQATWGNVQPWSNRGPGMLGDLAPDVVAVGAWGTGAQPLNLYFGNGQAAYDLFGGTSMATPIAAGNLALVYDAFMAAQGRWPTWEEARAILLNGARDLGYDPFSQGAGNVNADRSTDIAAGEDYWVQPAEWVAGDYRGTEYPAFPSVMHAGDSSTKTFTITNPLTSPVTIDISDTVLERVHEVTFTVDFASFAADNNGGRRPTWITDVTELVTTYDPDLIRAQVALPFSVFDSDSNYSVDDTWRVFFYDWSDLNGDGDLWDDTDSDGIIDAGEIDDNVSGLYEYNRFAYGYPAGTTNEVSVGRESLSRLHDGLFFGLMRRDGSDAVSIQVRITVYKKTDWGWLTTSDSTVTVPATSSVTFDATVSVPADTAPGAYQGAIEISEDTAGTHNIIPVIVHVAADSPTFDFGATSLNEPVGDLPYDNGHVFGFSDWRWRYEAGDWRLFYYDITDGTERPGRAMIVDTAWNSPQTDIDTWIFGAGEDAYSAFDPTFFGPSGAEQVGGSNDTYIGSGRFLFDTATGGAREIVSGELRDGLGFLGLHNVLNAGQQIGEPFTGSAYQVEVWPSPAEVWAENITIESPLTFEESWTVTFTSTRDIAEGIAALTFGLSQPDVRLDETTMQDDPDDECTSSWVDFVDIANGGLLDITTTSEAAGLDIDLYLYLDDGDGIWDCSSDTLLGSSTTSTAEEHVSVSLPADGRYWIAVHGWSVPGGSQPFDITIKAVQGTDLVVSGLPGGAISANTPVSFEVSFEKAMSRPSTWEGILFIGPAAAPTAIKVPVTVVAPAQNYLPIIAR